VNWFGYPTVIAYIYLLITFILLLIGFTLSSQVHYLGHTFISPLLVAVFVGHATFLHLRCFCLPYILQLVLISISTWHINWSSYTRLIHIFCCVYSQKVVICESKTPLVLKKCKVNQKQQSKWLDVVTRFDMKLRPRNLVRSCTNWPNVFHGLDLWIGLADWTGNLSKFCI